MPREFRTPSWLGYVWLSTIVPEVSDPDNVKTDQEAPSVRLDPSQTIKLITQSSPGILRMNL